MEVRCDKCQARYRVDDARIGPQGLTMRCGKCQNTFKVTKAEPLPTLQDQPPVPPAPKPAAAAAAPKPAPRPPEPSANATMVFGQSPVAPSKPAMPVARPGSSAKPAAKPAAAPADEGAGRTMMFQTGNLKTSPGAARPPTRPEAESNATMVFGQSPVAPSKPAMPAAGRPAAKPAEPDTGATMVFGQSPLAKPAAPARPAPAAKPGAKDDAAGSTMMFGASPVLAKAPTPARPLPVPVAAPEPVAEPDDAAAPEEPLEEHASEPAAQEEPAQEEEADASDSGVEAEGAEETTGSSAPADGAFDKAPPKGLLIGVAAGLAALLIAGGAMVAVKKLGKHPPPPAAVETLTSAQAEADKDTFASLAAAEGKAKDAIDVAGPKSAFPQATATLARIEIQWADALNDQAAMVTAKGGDGAEAKATELQAQAKAKLKAAFDVLSPAVKADPKSPDLQVTLADYYRAQRSGSTMNKALKSAQALKADEARIAQVQGMALAQEDDGAEKAIPKLKAALAGSPQSARVHFRLALAYQAMKDDANAAAELKETLKLSPQHERAKMALETAASTEGK